MEASNHQVHTYHSLQNALGVSSIKLWTCPVYVPDVLPTSVVESPHYSWGVVLSCGQCSCNWI